MSVNGGRGSVGGVRLISWNVAGRVRKLPEQAERLMDHAPDVVALQEITAITLPLWRSELEGRGYNVLASLDLAEDRGVLVGGRKYGVLLASKWPARVLSAVVQSPLGDLECHNAHLPAGVSHGYVKVETFECIYERLSRPAEHQRILCGDFNSPRIEREDGTTIPFGEDDPRWSAAELSVIRGLDDHDLPDAYRKVHGYRKQESSWVMKRKGKSYGRRFDHVFASSDLDVNACRYLHDLRERSLSDHSPIEAYFDVRRKPR